jgi:hypothetical protein
VNIVYKPAGATCILIENSQPNHYGKNFSAVDGFMLTAAIQIMRLLTA